MWPETGETQNLLQQAGAGNREAMNALWERHRGALRRLIDMRMDRALARRIDASDVVQDVIMEANDRLATYLKQPEMPFHLWLRQLAQDRIIDMHRRHRGAQRRSLDREQPLVAGGDGERSSLNLAGQLADAELTPAAATIRKELEARFLAAVEELEDDDRDIIVMRHFEQLGNTETATALGISTAAAGMRHLRALRKLRAILGDSPSQVMLPQPSEND